MKKIVSILAFASLLAAQSSYDYAYGLELGARGGEALSRVEFPNEVYLQTLSPTLKDVAVFNRNDQVVAFSLVDVEKKESITREIPVTLYFVSEKTNNTTGETTYTYLIKPSNITEPSYFKLDWESVDYNWEAKANVKFGEYTSARGVLLAELKDVSDESSLKADEIILEDYIYYYDTKEWQLIITSDAKIPKITSLKAYASRQYTDRSFVRFKAQFQEKTDNGAVYKLPSIQPVESVVIDLGQRDLILPLTLFYKKDGEWVKLDGRIVNEEADIKFQKTVFAEEFMLKTNGGFSDIPQLTVHRKRVDIVFNSANNAPFILAYGSFEADALDLSASDFLKGVDIDDIPIVYVGNTLKLGGESALEAKIKEESGIPKWAIWAVLVLGVAFLIFLAYKLSKELKSEQD